jgi:hypothetical protein
MGPAGGIWYSVIRDHRSNLAGFAEVGTFILELDSPDWATGQENVSIPLRCVPRDCGHTNRPQGGSVLLRHILPGLTAEELQ